MGRLNENINLAQSETCVPITSNSSKVGKGLLCMISARSGENTRVSLGTLVRVRTWVSKKAMVKLGGYSQSMTGSLKSSTRLVFKCFLFSSVYLVF